MMILLSSTTNVGAVPKIITAVVSSVIIHSMSLTPMEDTLQLSKTYDFGNGSSVVVENPMIVEGMTLEEPTFLGAGGGGAVFSYKQYHNPKSIQKQEGTNPKGKSVAVKFSWSQSAESVRNECTILKDMERKHVSGVERCLAEIQYKQDPRRSVIIMEPVVDDAVSSIQDLTTVEAQVVAVDGLMKTFVEMLAARIVTADIQPLISQRTGNIVLIDMTEAKNIISNDEPLSDTDKALVNNFCTEMITLIPESLFDQASNSFRRELERLEQVFGSRLDEDILKIVQDLPLLHS
jgi:hypothetical protein